MSFTNKLINPTPFDIEIPYDRGIKIKIPADGEAELVYEQVDDFVAGKPGSEEVRKLMNYYGVFLMDTNRSYEIQALETIRACIQARKSQFDEFVRGLRALRTQQGQKVDEEAMEEAVRTAGYARIRDQIETLKKREKFLAEHVAKDESGGKVRGDLDPSRTCFVTNPPKVFPTATALQMFFLENPDLKEKNDAIVKGNVENE